MFWKLDRPSQRRTWITTIVSRQWGVQAWPRETCLHRKSMGYGHRNYVQCKLNTYFQTCYAVVCGIPIFACQLQLSSFLSLYSSLSLSLLCSCLSIFSYSCIEIHILCLSQSPWSCVSPIKLHPFDLFQHMLAFESPYVWWGSQNLSKRIFNVSYFFFKLSFFARLY